MSTPKFTTGTTDPSKKYRQFSIVIHNIRPSTEPIIEEYLIKTLKVIKHCISIEPNPQDNGPGFHAHLFIKFSNAQSYKKLLRSLQALAPQIQAEKPEDETRMWNRTQLEQMYGEFQQAFDYLAGATKEKEIGEIHEYNKPPGKTMSELMARSYARWLLTDDEVRHPSHWDEEYPGYTNVAEMYYDYYSENCPRFQEYERFILYDSQKSKSPGQPQNYFLSL